jgi:hypothetical protein
MFARIAAASVLAAFLATAAHAAGPTIAQIKQQARSQIRKDAKSFLQQQHSQLKGYSVRVSFEQTRCGTPPVTLKAHASICTLQTAWPTFSKVRRPAYMADFSATGVAKNKVATERSGDWNAIYYVQHAGGPQ